MKIQLISSSPMKENLNQKEETFSSSAPPLGLLYLATCARQLGYDVRIIDQAAFGYTNDELIKHVQKWDPDIVGFSVLCDSVKSAKEIAARLKSWDPNLKVIFGNYMPTFYARRMLENYKWLDACVRGEGEESFIEYIEAIEKNGKLDDIRGIVFREGGRIKENTSRPPIKDLNALPIPDRTLLPYRYRNRAAGIDVSTKKFTIMVTSRGCPYSCTFCSCRTFTGGTFRARSASNVIAELCQLRDQGYKDVLFVDDNFTLKKNRVIELCEAIRKEKFDMDFSALSRINHASADMFREMKATNFCTVMFGFESGVQRILDQYNKKITLAMSRAAVKLARKQRIDSIIGTFLIGAYDETYEEAMETLKFISSIDIDFPQIVFTRALPATKIFDDMINRHILDEQKYWETGVDVIDLPGARMNRKIIKKILNAEFPKFFFNPRYISRAIFRFFTSQFRRELTLSHLNNDDLKELLNVVQSTREL